MPLKPAIKQCLFCLLASIALHPCFGQQASGRRITSIEPTTDFDQRFYYVTGETQNVWGYRAGVLINNRFKVGIGGYYMNKSTDIDAQSASLSGISGTGYTLHQKLYLGTIYYEPLLVRRKLWETSLVFETGYGRIVHYNMVDSMSKTSGESNSIMIPAGAGLSLNLKLPAIFHLQGFRWVGINIMGGYRTIIYQQDKSYSYNGVYWSLSGAIFLDRMVEDLRSWKKERQLARNKKAIELHY